MSNAVGIVALILVIILILAFILAITFFFVTTPGELGVTGFTGTGSDTVSNLGNKLILYQPIGTVSGTPTITLGSNNSQNITGKTFIIKNNSNLNTSSNTVLIAQGGTTISNIPTGSTKVSLPPGSAAWFVFNKTNVATLIGVVPNGSFQS